MFGKIYLVLNLRYSIDLSSQKTKLVKKMTMSKIGRKKLFVDESRIWNMEEPTAGAPSNMNLTGRSFLMSYMWYVAHVENTLNISGSSRNLAALGITEKTFFLENLVDTVIRVKEKKIIFIACKHGPGQF